MVSVGVVELPSEVADLGIAPPDRRAERGDDRFGVEGAFAPRRSLGVEDLLGAGGAGGLGCVTSR
jgi:hypothetical protein